jgi:hypothetical protein
MKRFLLAASLVVSGLALADIAPPPPEEAKPAAVEPAPAPAPQHPQGIENVMPPMGVIDGGWGYVYACYGLAIGGSLLYAVSLFLRRPTGGPPPGEPS